MLFMGFSRQEYQSGLPLPSPVDHVLSELSTRTHPSWVSHSLAHSFIELNKAVVHVINLISFLWLWFSFGLPSEGLGKRHPDGRDWLRVKLGLVLMGKAMLSKSLIQFSVDVQGYVPSLLFSLRSNYGGGNEENGDLLQKVLCIHYHTQYPWPCSRSAPPYTSTRDSWTCTDKSGPVSFGVTAPFSWVLMCTRFLCVCVPQESVSPVLCKFCIQSHSSPKSNALGVLPGTQVGKSVVVPRSSLTVREFLWYNYSAVSGLSTWRLSGGVNGELLQEGLCHTLVCCNQSPRACSQPLLTRASVGDTRTLNLWLRSWTPYQQIEESRENH